MENFIFCAVHLAAEVDVTNRGYLAEAVTKPCFAKKCFEIFGKNHRKVRAQESFLRT